MKDAYELSGRPRQISVLFMKRETLLLDLDFAPELKFFRLIMQQDLP